MNQQEVPTAEEESDSSSDSQVDSVKSHEIGNRLRPYNTFPHVRGYWCVPYLEALVHPT